MPKVIKKSLVNQHRISFVRAHKTTLFWALIILALCVTPGDTLPSIDFWELDLEDKAAHLFVFGLLAFLMVFGEQRRRGQSKLRFPIQLKIIFVGVLFGAFTEWVQGAFVPSRYASFGDAVADGLGCILGTIIASWVLKKFGRGRRSSQNE
jgi:hypothetical protein